MRRILCLLALTVGLVVSGRALAAVPATILYQGRLTDDTGANAIHGPVDLQFKVYSAASGGSPLWTEPHSGVPLDNGRFSVVLGSVIAFTPELLTAINQGLSLYLEIARSGVPINASARQLIGSSVYALHSAVSDSATVAGLTPGFALATRDNVAISASSGMISVPVTLNVPAPGFVVVTGSAFVANIATQYVGCLVTSNQNLDPAPYATPLGTHASDPGYGEAWNSTASGLSMSLQATNMFQVGSSGSVTYYMNIRANSPNVATLRNVILIATYYPAKY